MQLIYLKFLVQITHVLMVDILLLVSASFLVATYYQGLRYGKPNKL